MLQIHDILSESLYSLNRHKARTMLTGIGIAWGMFILILLLGIGESLRGGILTLFDDYSSNSVWITAGWTGKYVPGGREIGTLVKFNDETLKTLRREFPEIENISAEVSLDEFARLTRGDKIGDFIVSGIGSDYGVIKRLKMSQGRFINNGDIRAKRRVIVIGEQVRHALFGMEKALGQYIDIDGVPFQIVGVIDNNSIFARADENSVFMPNTTAFATYNVPREYSHIGMLLRKSEEMDMTPDEALRNCICRVLHLDSKDYGALYINNVQMQVNSFNKLFDGVQYFLWFVGICILLCGAIGVSNIMLLATKERFKEFGIRKALGATANSIMSMVLTESVMITVVFGFVGIALGYLIIILYGLIREILPSDMGDILGDGSVDPLVVVTAFIILLICGIAAGLYPARKASRVQPIKALNQE